jgi:serpin B
MVNGKGQETMPTEPAPRDAPAPAATADGAFSADLYRTLAQDAADTVFSPVSVTAALRMALCGARGQTAAELGRALHQDGSPDAAADGLRSLSAVVRSLTATGSITFRAPNTIWIQAGLPLLPAFTARLSGAAAATWAQADFAAAPAQARAEINRVIAGQTESKITDLLPPDAIASQTKLVLASAVYLKAAWTSPFSASATTDAAFYPEGPDQPSLTVPMMHGTGARAYLRGDGYQAVLLGYQGGSLAMAVVLPDGPLAALAPGIGTAGLGGLLGGATTHRVTLSLPRFRLEAAFDLVPALQRLGVREAFGNRADFSGVTEAEPLKLGTVAHKAYIDVDEHGTEAAAATAATVLRPSAILRPPPAVTVVVDRPFLFAIIDTAAGAPLFLGQVTHPRCPRAR